MHNIYDFLIVLVVFIVGVITGYFINICICRIPKGESVFTITNYCAHCDTRSKIRSLLVRFITGLVFVALLYKYGLTIEYIGHLYLTSVLVIVFFIDFEHKIIPNELVIAGLVGGLLFVLYNLFKPIKIYGDSNWWNPFLGILVGSGFLFIIAFICMVIYKSDHALGMGDVKIFAPIGIFLGWKMTIVTLILSIFIGGFTSLVLIIFNIKGRKSTIPFGPFIAASTFITLMWGWDILKWYLNMMV